MGRIGGSKLYSQFFGQRVEGGVEGVGDATLARGDLAQHVAEPDDILRVEVFSRHAPIGRVRVAVEILEVQEELLLPAVEVGDQVFLGWNGGRLAGHGPVSRRRGYRDGVGGLIAVAGCLSAEGTEGRGQPCPYLSVVEGRGQPCPYLSVVEGRGQPCPYLASIGVVAVALGVVVAGRGAALFRRAGGHAVAPVPPST